MNAVEQKEQSSFDKMELLKWLIMLLVPLAAWLTPMPVDPVLKKFIVITAWGITSWIVTVLPVAVTGVLLPCLYLFFGVAEAGVVFAPWANTIIWMVTAVIVIGVAADKSNFSLRVAYNILLRLDCSLRGLIWGFSVSGIFLAFIVTDVVTRCIVFVTIAVGICKALGIPPKSREATALCLAAFFGMSGPSIGTFTAGNGLALNSVFREAMGYSITYGQWLLHNFIPALVWTLLGVICIIKVLKIGKENSFDAKGELQRRLAGLGKITTREKLVFMFLLFVVSAIILSGYIGLDPMLSVSLLLLFMFMPGIKIVDFKDFEQANFTILFVMAGAMAIGVTAANVGLVDIIVNYLTPIMSGSAIKMTVGAYVFASLANFILTPLAIVFTFTELFTQMAVASGVNPLPVLYALNLGTDVYIFPYEYAVLLIAFSFGYMNYADTVKVLIARALTSTIVMGAVMLPLWYLLGLI